MIIKKKEIQFKGAMCGFASLAKHSKASKVRQQTQRKRSSDDGTF